MSLPFLPCFSSLFLLLVLIFHIPSSNGEPASFECNNNTYNGITAANYTNNSIFQTNLKILLPSLSSNVSLTKGFYNTSIGEGSDKVYGLVLCRGDVQPDNCRNCTDYASEDILNRCKSRSSAIWYDLCQLQYSDTNFFNLSITPWWFYVWSMNNMTSPEVEPFKAARGQLMRHLANKTAYEPWRGMFATGELNYSSTNNVYGLMQCKPVISAEACHRCLQDAIGLIPNCCDSRIGGRVIGEVCNLRFEDRNFFGESLVGVPPPPPPSPGTKSPRIIVFVIPAIAVAIILFIIAVVLLRKKKIYSRMRRTDTSSMAAKVMPNRHEEFIPVVNPGLQQFVRDSLPRERGQLHRGFNPMEEPALTPEEFEKAKSKLREHVFKPTRRTGLFSRSQSNTTASHPAAAAKDDDEGKQCTICLDAFVPNQKVLMLLTPCNHMFHSNCLLPWVKSHGKCPVCRHALVERRENAISTYNGGYWSMTQVQKR